LEPINPGLFWENRDEWDPYLEWRCAYDDFPLWPRAFTLSYTERVSFQWEGKNLFWMDISGLGGVTLDPVIGEVVSRVPTCNYMLALALQLRKA